MTTREAEDFIASVPWRAVKMVEVGDTGKTPDPHEYVIKDWRDVDIGLFDSFVRLIKAKGYRATYRAPYRPEYVITQPLPRDQRLVLLVHPAEHAQPGAGRGSEARADPRLGGFAPLSSVAALPPPRDEEQRRSADIASRSGYCFVGFCG